MLEKEKAIREQRLVKAISNNYMGLDGKLGIILKALGESVVSQHSNCYESTEWRDMFMEDDDLPTEDPEITITEIGKIFSGLKYGHHIEITYMQDGKIPVEVDEYQHIEYEWASKVLTVNYKGYIVYLEAEGSLIMYLPHDDWEDIINKIYQSAEKIYKEKKMAHGELIQMDDKIKKLSLLQRLRDKWGI